MARASAAIGDGFGHSMMGEPELPDDRRRTNPRPARRLCARRHSLTCRLGPGTVVDLRHIPQRAGLRKRIGILRDNGREVYLR
jgi:hypothetical protein